MGNINNYRIKMKKHGQNNQPNYWQERLANEDKIHQEPVNRIKDAMPWIYDGDIVNNDSGRFKEIIRKERARKSNCNVS